MTMLRTKDLSGEALEWSFQYAGIIQEIIGDRRDSRPRRADHAEALERMTALSPEPLDAEHILALITTHRIATFEDNRVWYALPSSDIASWRRDMDGDEMLAMIDEEDVVSASTLPDAVKKCFVRMVLGDHVDTP